MKYFTADLHFGDLRLFYRLRKNDFKSILEHDEVIFSNIINPLGEKDELFLLGDFGADTGTVEKMMFRLKDVILERKAQVHFFMGNHDRPFFRFYYNLAKEREKYQWMFIRENYVVKIGDRKVYLTHYPTVAWDGSHRGEGHLYGHLHNGGRVNKINPLGGRTLNVNIELNDYRTWNEKEIGKRLETAEYNWDEMEYKNA